MFKQYYSQKFIEIFGSHLQPEDGIGDEVVKAALLTHQLTIPQALIEYYVIAGQHWINQHHHQLLSLQEMKWIDDYLVFLKENQGVVYWGICQTDISEANPIVWQGITNDSIQWYEEADKLSEFLMAMWAWTILE